MDCNTLQACIKSHDLAFTISFTALFTTLFTTLANVYISVSDYRNWPRNHIRPNNWMFHASDLIEVLFYVVFITLVLIVGFCIGIAILCLFGFL